MVEVVLLEDVAVCEGRGGGGMSFVRGEDRDAILMETVAPYNSNQNRSSHRKTHGNMQVDIHLKSQRHSAWRLAK